jgi:hypothetical protein
MEERRLGESKYGWWRLLNLGIDGILSLVSPVRLVVLLIPVGLLATAAMWCGAWPVSAAIAIGGVSLVRRYLRLSRPDLMQQMRVLECANVQDEPLVIARVR